MSHPRINVNDSFAWGKLIKTWATGKNYVDHVATETHPIPTKVQIPPIYPKPSSFKELAQQAISAKVGLYFEDKDETPVTGDEKLGFLLVQATLETYVLRLPAKDAIERSEKQLLAGEVYELPDFYDRVFEAHVKPTEVKTGLQRMQFHAERVGEYTINTCH